MKRNHVFNGEMLQTNELHNEEFIGKGNKIEKKSLFDTKII